MIMYHLGPQLGVWIMQVSTFSSVLINRFHCSQTKLGQSDFLYIIDGKVNEFLVEKPMSGQFSNLIISTNYILYSSKATYTHSRFFLELQVHVELIQIDLLVYNNSLQKIFAP